MVNVFAKPITITWTKAVQGGELSNWYPPFGLTGDQLGRDLLGL